MERWFEVELLVDFVVKYNNNLNLPIIIKCVDDDNTEMQVKDIFKLNKSETKTTSQVVDIDVYVEDELVAEQQAISIVQDTINWTLLPTSSVLSLSGIEIVDVVSVRESKNKTTYFGKETK